MTNLKSQIRAIKSFVLNDNFERLFEFINPNSYFLNFYCKKFLYKDKILSPIGIMNKSIKVLLYKSINDLTIFKTIIMKSIPIKDSRFKESKSIDYFYFIFSKISKKLDFVISKEEFPNLYIQLEEDIPFLDFDYINTVFKNLSIADFNYRSISNSNSLNKDTESLKTTFDKSKAVSYCEEYSLKYNPYYISYDKNGGDCTNFASQILHAGGLSKSNAWFDYSNPWVRVKELRNYLINNNLAKEFNDLDSDCEGALIQFFNPELKDWTHTGFITYSFEDDYLYCCHSYDKLNYPLSLAYPLIYKKIRVLKINSQES